MAQHRPTGARDLVITCIKGDGSFLKFWALPLNALDTVKNFETQFYKKISELESAMGFMRSNQIPVGSKCAVKSKIKQMWCRARVLDQQGISNVLVQLMDYGNEEVIPVSDVRSVEDQIFHIPPQAVECILADVIPTRGNEWLPEAIHFCEQHLLYNTLSCYVVSEYMKLPVVRVAKKGENEPFVQRLINSGLAFIKQDRASPPPPPPPALFYKVNNMDQNTVHLVRVSCVESVHKFYVQLSAAEMELKNLMDSLNSMPVESLSLVKLPAVNTPCLAKLATKPCYYRVLITHVQRSRCKIFFVDYGYSELKEFQELRAIPPTFLGLAAQAICCSLPRDVNLDSDDFRRLVMSEHLQCHVQSRTPESYIVKLLKREQDILIVSQSFTQQKLNVGASYDVTVSYVNDLTEFYIHLTHFKDQQHSIYSILNSNYIFTPISFSECKPGKPVCVKYTEDNLWYRAKITKINHEHDIEVFFVDFGNFDNVSLSDVRKMTADLLKFPIQAFKSYLFEMPIPTDSKAKDDVFDLFEELTNGQTLVAHIKAFMEESNYGIKLFPQNSKMSINEKLISSFISIPVVSVSEIENLYITSFDTPDSFFAQLEKLDSEKLTLMQEEINLFYSGSQNASYVPKEGNLVCARFDDDDQYYRAKVENFTANNLQCEVFFLDYGNKATIPVSDVHVMDITFTKYPQFGFLCAFENFPVGMPNEELCSMMLENSIQGKMVRQENNKWYISLTENYPSNIPILKLFKQRENPVPRSIHGAGLGGYKERPFVSSNAQAPITSSWQNDNQVPVSSGRNETMRQTFNTDRQKIKESPPFSCVSTPDLEELGIDYSSISVPSNAYRNVYVSHVISPSEFYCQIEEDSSKLQALMKSIEDAYAFSNENLNFSKFVVSTPCCAIFEDGAWYRGKIKEVHPNSCDIFFVDYGNTDTIENTKLKKLRSDLFTFPTMAFQCKSFNISPKNNDWNDDEINAFVNMTLDKSFVAQFVECDSNCVYAVNLVSIGKLQHDIFNKEFVNLGFGRLEDSSKSLSFNSHSASTNLTFPLPKVELGVIESVEVTYGLNPGEIFCQLKSSASEFKKMMINLQDYYNKISEAESLIDRPHAGMICVAQFHLDSAWYRAEIKKVEANKILVFYVDYGNYETVERKKARCIIQDYTLLPVQAVKCRIRGIKPPSKSWIVNNNLSRYFEGNADCKFISRENDYFLVDMICNQNNVAQLLVADKLALFDGSIEEIKTIAVPAIADIPVIKPKLREREDSFVPGQLISVIVSFIHSPCKFWCQLLDDAEILEQLMADIEAQNQNSEDLPINPTSLNVGSYCIAQYYVDEAWYRAQLKSCQQDNSYEVFFVDYGNTEVVAISQIKDILPQFAELPPQCFECCLQYCPQNTTDEMKTLFQGVIDEAEEITAKIERSVSRICTVTLLYEKDDQEVNVSELLFGAMDQIDESAVTQEPPRFLPPDVPLGLQDGYVSIVNTPQDFYIQLAGTEDALADLSTELAGIYESSEETLANFSVGYACCAKYSEDSNWYRAEITSMHDSTMDVLFVDYGNVDTVEQSTLRGLTDKFLEMPPLAIKCKLNGIAPLGEEWPEEAINTFQQMVEDSCLGITFISKDIPATVNITKDDKEVAHCLVDMELANVETCAETDEAYAEDHLAPPIEDPLSSLPYDQSYPERKLSSTKLAVKICYIDNYDKFYAMPLELSTELDTVMTTLELLYASDKTESNSNIPDVLEDPKVLMPCVAKYSEDEAWYRALITEIDGENIFVSFIDYGNFEVTSIKNLRPITPELVKIPPIAMECSLYGIEAVSGQEAAITTKLEEYFVDEVELEVEVLEESPYKIKLHHGADVASLLVQEGLATEKVVESSAEDTFIASSKMESLEFKIQISKRFFTGVDKIVGFVKFCELENEHIAFYVVSTDLEDELQDLQQKLQDAYSEPPQNLSTASCMDFCATKYMEDENWYRAQVLYCDKDKVKVRFIDYGNCETVDRSDIYELLPDFSVEPQFSVKCILFGLKVNKNKEVELQNRLDEYVYHDTVELKLCTFGHAACDPCITSVICGDMDLSELIMNENLVSQQYVTNSQLDDKFKATIQKIESTTFHVFPLHLTNERDDFQCKLQETCKDLSISPSAISNQHLCAAKIVDRWHRISVVDTLNDNVTVNLVDFGPSVTTNATDLILLPADFCHQPLFLQPCIFEESDKINTKKLQVGATVSCELVKNILVDQPLKIKVLEIVSVLVSDISTEEEDREIVDAIDPEKDVNFEDVKNTEKHITEDVVCANDVIDIIENIEGSVTHIQIDITEDTKESFTQSKIKESTADALAENCEETFEGALNDQREIVSVVPDIVKESLNKHAIGDITENKNKSVNDSEENVIEDSTSDVQMSYSNLVSDKKNDVRLFELSGGADEECDIIPCNSVGNFESQESEKTSLVNVGKNSDQIESIDVKFCNTDFGVFTQNLNLTKDEENFDNDLKELVQSIDMEEIEKSFEEKYFDIEGSPKHNMNDVNKCDSEKLDINVEDENQNSDLDHNTTDSSDVLSENKETVDFADNNLNEQLDSKDQVLNFNTGSKEVLDAIKSDYKGDIDRDNTEPSDIVKEETHCVNSFNIQPEDNIKEKSDDTNIINLSHSLSKNFGVNHEGQNSDLDQNTIDSSDALSENKNAIYFANNSLDEKLDNGDQELNFNADSKEKTDDIKEAHNVDCFYMQSEDSVKKNVEHKNSIDVMDTLSDYKAGSYDIEGNQEEQSCIVKQEAYCNDSFNIQSEDNIKEKSDDKSSTDLSESLPENFETEDTVKEDLEGVKKDIESYDDNCGEQKCISEDSKCKNNITIPESYQLFGSVQVKISDIAISDGSVIFAVQPLDHEEKFLHLKSTMQKHYSSNSELLDDSYEANICAVLHDDEWCRGKILQKGEDVWTILLIDYGKCIDVDGCNVKNLSSEHCNLPSFAIWCTFAGVVCSPEKSENVKEHLSSILQDAVCVVKILEGGEPYKINLLLNNFSVLNQLLKNDLVSQKLPDLYIESGSYKAKVSHLNINSKTVEMFVYLSTFSEDLIALSKSIQSMYKVEESVSTLVESGIYCVFHNNLWSRAVVQSTVDKTLYLLDTGETVIGCTNLCFLLPEHCLQPPYAISCDSPFSNVPSNALKSVCDILKEKEFVVGIKVCPDTNSVSATLVDEQVMVKLEESGLTCNDSEKTKFTDEYEKSKVEEPLSKIVCTESTKAPAPVQESNDQIVGYLQETFFAETS